MWEVPGIGVWPAPKNKGGGGNTGTPPPTGTIIDPPDDRYYPGLRNGLDTIGPRLINLDVAFSLYGVSIPIHLGTGRMYGNMIWAKALSEKKLQTQNAAGGTDIKYQYYANCAVSLGMGGNLAVEKRQLLKMWANGNLIVDNTSGGRTIARGVFYRFYPGTETQMPDPSIEAFEGVGNVSAFRDLMYVVFVDFPLADYDNKMPYITALIGDVNAENEVVVSITATGEGNNSGDVGYDPVSMRAFVQNSTGVDGIFVYDLANETFLGKTEVNPNGVPQGGGGLNTGLEILRPVRYMPWNRMMVGNPDGTAIAQTVMIFDPLTGVVKAYLPDSSRLPFTMQCGRATLPGGLKHITVIATTSDDGQVDYAVWNEQTNGMRDLGQIDNAAYDEGARHCFNVGTLDGGIRHFISNGDDVDMINLTGAMLQPPQNQAVVLPTPSAAYIPYDGVDTTTVNALFFYEQRNALLIIYANGEARLVDLASLSNIWRTSGLPGVPADGYLEGDASAGYVAWCNSGGNVRELNLDNGAVLSFAVASSLLNPGETAFHSPSRSIIGHGTSNGRLSRVFYARADGDRVSIKTIIEKMGELAGYESSEIDVGAEITEEVDGCTLTEPTSFEELTYNICTAYGFIRYESDGKIKFRNKSAAFAGADFTVNIEDVVVDNKDDAAFQLMQEEESAIPATVRLRYMDSAVGNLWNTQQQTRSVIGETNSSRNSIELTLPFAMQAGEAKKIAGKMLWNAWSGRSSVPLQFPKEITAKMEPGDVADIVDSAEGTTYTLQVIDHVIGEDKRLQVKCREFQISEDYDVPAFAGTPFEQQIATQLGAQFIYLDVPLLDPSDEVFSIAGGTRFYYVIAPTDLTGSFAGGTGYLSYDNGINWTPLEASDFAVPVAQLVSDFGAPAVSPSIDEVNELHIRLTAGDFNLLQTITGAEMQLGGNMAAIGGPGHWEIIHYREVELQLDGSYILRGIARGQKGTSWMSHHLQFERWASYGLFGSATATAEYLLGGSRHKAGDMFVMLDSAWIKKGVHPTAPVDMNVTVSAARTAAGAPDNAVGPYKVTRIDLMPRACSGVRVERDSFGKLTVFWRPCPRTGYALQPGDVAPVFPTDTLPTFDIFVILPERTSNGNFPTDTPWDYFNNPPHDEYGLTDQRRTTTVFNASEMPAVDFDNLAYFGSWGSSASFINTLGICYRAQTAGTDYEFTFPFPMHNNNDDFPALTPYGILEDADGGEKVYLDYDYVYVCVLQRSTWEGFAQPLNRDAVWFKTFVSSDQETVFGLSRDSTPRPYAPNETASVGLGRVFKCFVEDV